MKNKFLLLCFCIFSLSAIHLRSPSSCLTTCWDGSLDSTRPAITDAIRKLEKAMKYKFALNFLISHRRLWELGLLQDSDTTQIRMEKNLSVGNLIERFRIGDYSYDLWKIKSMNGDKEYVLLADSGINGTGELDLFLYKGGEWHFCDSLELSSRGEGLYEITQLNSHNVIKVERASDMTGYYREDEAYVAISDEKFRNLFDFTRLEIYQPEGEENSKWRVGEISLVDLNHDGFLDIVEKEKEEIMQIPDAEWRTFASTELGLTKDSHSYYKMKAKKIISQKEYKYIWNDKTCTFDREH